jgi:hypothetical protein
MRKASRLCAEEARAASDPVDRKELAAKVADLARVAETIDPDSRESPGGRLIGDPGRVAAGADSG